MKHNRIELVGTIRNINIQLINSTWRVKLGVETEDINSRLRVTVWESDHTSGLNLLTIGTNVRIVGRIRVKHQTTAFRMEKTVRDIVANRVEILDAI